MAEPWTDWIEDFLAFSEGLPSPEIFRLWSAIGALAGALERRVWSITYERILYPNLYVLLVAPPGVGKLIITEVSDLWYDAGKFNMAPDSLSRAGLIDALAMAKRQFFPNDHTCLEYHSMLVASDELGVLVSAHDLDFLSILNKIFDNPKYIRDKKRHMGEGKEINISNPQLNLLMGSQPGFLASVLPEEAWSMGFTSRLIMIYAAQGVKHSLFAKRGSREGQRNKLLEGLKVFSNLCGEVEWEADAAQELDRWHLSGEEPKPEHSKLAHYASRRTLNLIKLSMIAAISRTCQLRITLYDLNRARDWLLHAEQLMPEIFREMSSSSDSAVIQELHWYLWIAWNKEKKPIHEGRLVDFVKEKVPAHNVMRVIEIAEKSNIIMREAGTKLYTPRAKYQHGQE